MTVLFDKHRRIVSPALAPTQPREADEFERRPKRPMRCSRIGLINNMPDPALQATERQFTRLLQAAAGDRRIHLHCFSLPSVKRSPQAKALMDGPLHRHRRSRPPATRWIDRHRRRADCRDASRGAVLERPHRRDRLGESQHPFDDLVVPCRPCRGAASRRHRAAAARREMLRRLRLRQGGRRLADEGYPLAAQDRAFAHQCVAQGATSPRTDINC